MTQSPTRSHGTVRLNPTETVLTGSLIVAPLLYLAPDSTYAARGWTDATAGALHILGAIAYGFVVIRMATWLTARPGWSVVVLVTGLLGMAGNVAYGFDTIHMSLGDTALVHQPGMANIIKPLGLFFPASFALIAIGLLLLQRRWQGILVLTASLAWPIAHIGNIAWLAVAVNVLLVVALGALGWQQRSDPLGQNAENTPSRYE